MYKEYKELNFDGYDYKGYNIAYNLYGINEYTVQYCGDDFCFESKKDAKIFIDNIDNLDI